MCFLGLNLSYQLRELTQEWGQLQMAVMEELETYALAHPERVADVMPTARRTWARLCWDGISDSTSQYWHLHQAEANGHVRELEQALATLNELDQARTEAWREATHDLQGSLSVVSGASIVLDRKNVTDGTRHEFSDLLNRGVASLHEMLNDLMSLARLDAGLEQRKVAPFDAGVLLREFCETSLPLANERGLFLKMEGPTSHAGDEIHAQEKSVADLDHAPTVPAQSIPLPVSQQPGEGVGLSIVKRLCELLDASLELETSPGEGSTFRVVLPQRYQEIAE